MQAVGSDHNRTVLQRQEGNAQMIYGLLRRALRDSLREEKGRSKRRVKNTITEIVSILFVSGLITLLALVAEGGDILYGAGIFIVVTCILFLLSFSE